MSQSQVTLSINNKSITVAAGTTVIKAAIQSGVEVPHFCWHPGLSIAGVCRFCMVRIEGMPKLQIACNTFVSEGMKVDTLSSDVKEAHKWALEFHLINHPLDCPICDQAGECELQNYYMKVGKYTSKMDEDKVLKPKTIPVSKTLVLDTERCILCTRCVRFEDEVTKTSGLGIFSRGDRAVIGTFEDRKITHNYTYNLADVCPVGAFTSSDFRFKCRVWFLKEFDSICPGCSTGCNIKVFQNQQKREYYRIKPRHNADVNGHWMCDEGRQTYKHCNASERLASPREYTSTLDWTTALEKLKNSLQNVRKNPSELALVLTPQYTNEEYTKLFLGLKSILGNFPTVYLWRDSSENFDAFDGILLRGDRNPNSAGLTQILNSLEIKHTTLSSDFSELARSKPTATWILGPELSSSYPNRTAAISKFQELPQTVYFGSSLDDMLSHFWLQIPTKVFTEKNGTYVNFKGIAQKLHAQPSVFQTSRAIDEIIEILQKGTLE